MDCPDPSYLALLRDGQLADRARRAVEALADCTLCGRACHADRRRDEAPEGSFCRTGRRAVVHGAFAHPGEELCLRGWKGSGTIFFSQCNLRCVFCQNFDISWQGLGRRVAADALADMMLDLQEQGCHNINLVTPSHVVAQILEALVIAAEQGLRLPLVYNTGGYDSLRSLQLLDGVVDIYMPDFKFWSTDRARRWAQAEDYREVATRAIQEMHRQVGDLVTDDRSLARRGLLVRHLVMPDGVDDTRQIMRLLAREISPRTMVNVMSQYHPEGKAYADPVLSRPITGDEYRRAVEIAKEEGLTRLIPH